ncbi:MAG: MFS transporter [Planctomycetales bacterium]|nr:MFS transporter [Planctomycetales bacterium]
MLFSTGDLTSSLPLAIQMFFQLYFLTDVARLSPASAGWILGISRAWDAINDPLVGFLSDRIRSKHGRRRVLLLYGSVPLGVLFALNWLVPPFSENFLVVYYTTIIIAFDTAFTVVHVGYNSLTPGMTQDYDERSSLNGYRMGFSLGGTLGAIIFASLLDEFLDSESVRFALIGVTLGIITIIPPWVVMAVAKESDTSNAKSNLSVRESLVSTLRNRAFLFLMAIYLLSWTAASILAAMLVYLARYYFLVPEQANYFVLVAEGSAIAFLPVTVWMSKKTDKQTAYIAGIAFWCIVLGTIAALDRQSIGWAYCLSALCGPGIATALVIPWAMVPDIIEDDQLRTGERREGTFYSLVAFFQKLGTGLALWFIGQALAATGYLTPTEAMPVPTQPEPVINAIRIIIGPITIALLCVSLPIAWFYPIDRETHHRQLEALNSGSPD